LALRNPRSGLIRNEITRNGWVWAALALCVVLLVVAVFLPVLSTVLQTANPGPNGWALLLALSAAPLIAGQVVREVQRHAVPPSAPH
ncbi:MAG: cation transporting ATPase C-terminal domain-containing protein, partial [Austwickia sp.]|nr:cation transporting ATPase C-terminal domain-containing protein [Austwickia sp.]